MKHYAKFLLVAFFTGFFCVINCAKNGTIKELSDIILLFGFYNVNYYPQYIMEITYWFIPLLLFQIIYGTYIYRHFCCASIYFFSRCCNRTVWFLKEMLVLYLFAVVYLFVLIFSGFMAANLFTPVKIGQVSILLLGYYLLIHSLFLLFTTLLINILAILFTSNVSFMIVEGISLFGVAAFCLMGNYFVTQDEFLPQYTWMLKLNPIAHLIFSVHGSSIERLNCLINVNGISFDLNLSVFVYLAGIVIVMISGCFIVNYHDFLNVNQEIGGI